MKKIYSILILTSCLVYADIYAQAPVKHLDINNLKIPLFSRGGLFREYSVLENTSEFPKGSGLKMVSNQNIWFGGLDQNNELRLAGQMYMNNNSSFDHFIGPISESTLPEQQLSYNKVWKISKTEIEDHIAHSLSPTYIIPEDILTWPAHGDLTKGEAQNLAPFEDVNHNGIYEPELGDYPKIRGDQALYAIFNDVNGDHTTFYGQKVYAEVHVMLYGYHNPYSDFLENTFFLHYEIYNRSENITYPNFYVTLFSDFQHGYHYDNYVGTDVGNNMFYSYNADNFDEGSFGYGENPPAFGWTLLNSEFTSTRILWPSFGRESFPKTAQEAYKIMQGKFTDGSSMTHGTTDHPTLFAYPGTSHPDHPSNWTEFSDGNSPSSKATTASTMINNFGPGDKICLDYAGVFSWDLDADNFHQINQLIADVNGVKSVYNYENFECALHELTMEEVTIQSDLDFVLVDDALTIKRSEFDTKDHHLRLVNTLGQTIFQFNFSAEEKEKTIQLKHLTEGIYFIPKFGFKFVIQ